MNQITRGQGEVILVDVLNHHTTVRPGLNISGVLNIVHPSLLPTVTAEEPSAQEDRESQEEPDVAHDSQEKLCGRHARSVAGRVVFHGHDEEGGVVALRVCIHGRQEEAPVGA